MYANSLDLSRAGSRAELVGRIRTAEQRQEDTNGKPPSLGQDATACDVSESSDTARKPGCQESNNGCIVCMAFGLILTKLVEEISAIRAVVEENFALKKEVEELKRDFQELQMRQRESPNRQESQNGQSHAPHTRTVDHGKAPYSAVDTAPHSRTVVQSSPSSTSPANPVQAPLTSRPALPPKAATSDENESDSDRRQPPRRHQFRAPDKPKPHKRKITSTYRQAVPTSDSTVLAGIERIKRKVLHV